jgi:hypothetical protein
MVEADTFAGFVYRGLCIPPRWSCEGDNQQSCNIGSSVPASYLVYEVTDETEANGSQPPQHQGSEDGASAKQR